MNELLESGLTITAIGMGVVFVLLTALVWIIQGMSALAAALSKPTSPTATPLPAARAADIRPADAEIVAVAAAAIAAYRRRRGRT